MNGTCALTGKPLSGAAHLLQSVADILTTPLGGRVMRRDYGSMLPRLVDRPVTPGFYVELFAATADALAKWEPRISVTGVEATTDGEGRVTLTVTGRWLIDGEPVTLEGIVL